MAGVETTGLPLGLQRGHHLQLQHEQAPSAGHGAFFVLNESHADGDRTGKFGIACRHGRVHRQVQAGADRGALLLMDPYNWDEPFRAGRELCVSGNQSDVCLSTILWHKSRKVIAFLPGDLLVI